MCNCTCCSAQVQRPLCSQKVLKDKVKRGITTVLEKKEELNRSFVEVTKDMLPAFKRLLKNKALNCLVIGDVFLFLQIGAYSFYPKIYAMIFRFLLNSTNLLKSEKF